MKRKKVEPFVMLPRTVLEATPWHELSGNALALVVYLMREHLRQGGRANGDLLAPYDRLVAFGIRRKSVPAAIIEAERAGLIEVRRNTGPRHGFRKPANRYRLAWLS